MNREEQSVLITGGAGFIGSHLVDAFLRDGYRVGVIDNFSTGHKSNLAEKSIELITADISDPVQVKRAFETFKPTTVLHHAAQVSVRHSLEDPDIDATINILGTINLLKQAKQGGVDQFVFASSGGAVYGESQDRQPFTEDSAKVPLSPYGISKLSGEHYINHFAKQHHLPVTILRYGNVFGPRQDPRGEAGVITMFLERMAIDEPVTIFGTGEQVRDFVYVGDVVAANQVVVTQRALGIFNVGSGVVTSVNQLYRAVAGAWQKATGNEVKPAQYLPAIEGEVYWSQIDINRIKQQLNWAPSMALADGLLETIEWYNGYRKETT